MGKHLIRVTVRQLDTFERDEVVLAQRTLQDVLGLELVSVLPSRTLMLFVQETPSGTMLAAPAPVPRACATLHRIFAVD